MADFLTILNFFKGCILSLFALRIPLGSDYSLEFGSVCIGLICFPLLLKIFARIFETAALSSSNKSDKKGGDK